MRVIVVIIPDVLTADVSSYQFETSNFFSPALPPWWGDGHRLRCRWCRLGGAVIILYIKFFFLHLFLSTAPPPLLLPLHPSQIYLYKIITVNVTVILLGDVTVRTRGWPLKDDGVSTYQTRGRTVISTGYTHDVNPTPPSPNPSTLCITWQFASHPHPPTPLFSFFNSSLSSPSMSLLGVTVCLCVSVETFNRFHFGGESFVVFCFLFLFCKAYDSYCIRASSNNKNSKKLLLFLFYSSFLICKSPLLQRWVVLDPLDYFYLSINIHISADSKRHFC